MNDYTIVNGELYHYGVPGMKWGHRKAKGFVSTQKPKRPFGMVVKDGPQKPKKSQKVELSPEQRTSRAVKKLKITKGAAATLSALALIGSVTIFTLNEKRHADNMSSIKNRNNIKHALGRVRAGRTLATALLDSATQINNKKFSDEYYNPYG